MVENGTETDHLERLGGQGPKRFRYDFVMVSDGQEAVWSQSARGGCQGPKGPLAPSIRNSRVRSRRRRRRASVYRQSRDLFWKPGGPKLAQYFDTYSESSCQITQKGIKLFSALLEFRNLNVFRNFERNRLLKKHDFPGGPKTSNRLA